MRRLSLAFLVCGLLACDPATEPPATSQVTPAPTELVVIRMADGGEIRFRFLADKAPGHAENFRRLAGAGFYDGTTFHRVIPGFMIQGGDPNSKDDDPTNDGMGNAGYFVKAEFNDVPHVRGVVSMARSSHPDSASSQFFIMVADQQPDGVPWAKVLDGKYTAFGEVLSGMDVVDRIANTERGARDRPNEVQRMESVAVVPAG